MIKCFTPGIDFSVTVFSSHLSVSMIIYMASIQKKVWLFIIITNLTVRKPRSKQISAAICERILNYFDWRERVHLHMSNTIPSAGVPDHVKITNLCWEMSWWLRMCAVLLENIKVVSNIHVNSLQPHIISLQSILSCLWPLKAAIHLLHNGYN